MSIRTSIKDVLVSSLKIWSIPVALIVLYSALELHERPEGAGVIKNLPKFSPRGSLLVEKNKLLPLVRLTFSNGNACSGFVIDDHYVVTAGHCVQGNLNGLYMVNPVDQPDFKTPARGAGFNMRLDYGIVYGDFTRYGRAQINPYWPSGAIPSPMGYHVACGFAMGQNKATCTTIVLVGVSYFQYVGHGLIYPGMSGGPVFNPITGEVVGVISAMDGNGTSYISSLVGLLGAFGIEP